jgi:hypothetical protein
MNMALASTFKALENPMPASKRTGPAKEDITTPIAEGNQTLKRELTVDMKNLKEDILAEAHTYTDIMTQDLRSKIDGQFDTLTTSSRL